MSPRYYVAVVNSASFLQKIQYSSWTPHPEILRITADLVSDLKITKVRCCFFLMKHFTSEQGRDAYLKKITKTWLYIVI